MRVRFGPAGNSESFYNAGHKSTLEAPAWLNGMGLDAYEYQCGRGVFIKKDTAVKLGSLAKEYDIGLSLHAPYFVSLANPDEEIRKKTIGHILKSCEAAANMGAKRVILHSGSLMKRTRAEALEIACETLSLAIRECDDKGFGDITLCPELMGVRNQLGDLDEVITLCSVDKRLIPCIDFGHYNARNYGTLKTGEDYAEILDRLEAGLGYERIKSFHAHFSRIEYTTPGGELRHLTFEDTEYGPFFDSLADLLVKRKLTPVIICESAGTQAEDAANMRLTYEEAAKQYKE